MSSHQKQIKVEEQRSYRASHFEGLANNFPNSKEKQPCPYPGPASDSQRWVPQNLYVHQPHGDPDVILRKIRGVLNKITPEKFEPLCQEIINIGIYSPALLNGIAVLIYEKAVDEHRYSSLYANLCRRLWFEAPNFDKFAQPAKYQPTSTSLTSQPVPSQKSDTFRRFLIAKLQEKFETRYKKLNIYESKENLTTDEEEQRAKAKHHVLGNIKFIGELYRLDFLHEKILHNCIKELIKNKSSSPTSSNDFSRDLECLCQIMNTCGRKLDHERAKSLTNQYFQRMKYLYEKKDALPPRIRFMLQDVIDLRSSNWTPRHPQNSRGPRTLGQIRSEISEENPNLMFDPEFMRITTNNSSYSNNQQRYYGNRGGGAANYYKNNGHRSNNNSGGYDMYPNDQRNKQAFDFFGPNESSNENNYSQSSQLRHESGNNGRGNHKYENSHHHYQNGTSFSDGYHHHQQHHQQPAYEPSSRQPIMPIRKSATATNNSNLSSTPPPPSTISSSRTTMTRGSAYDPYPSWNKTSSTTNDANKKSEHHQQHNNNMDNGASRKTPASVAPATAGTEEQLAYEFSRMNNDNKAAVTNGTSRTLANVASTGVTPQQSTRSLSSVVANSSAATNNKKPTSPSSVQRFNSVGGHNFTKLGGVGGLSKRSPQLNTQQQTTTTPPPQQQQTKSSVDAFQPSYQHVIDNAPQMRKKSPVVNNTASIERQQQQQQQDKNKQKNTTTTTSRQQQQQTVVTQLQQIPSPYPQQEEKEKLEQIARQLLVANIKTKEYQHHFDRLTKLNQDLVDECCTKMVEKSLSGESNDEKKMKASLVLKQLHDKQLVTLSTIQKIFQQSLNCSDQLDNFVPLFTKSLQLGLMELNQFALLLSDLQNENKFSLLISVFKQLSTLSGQEQFSEDFSKADIDLLAMMPESSRSKINLLEELEKVELQYIAPFVAMESGMTSQLNLNSNPTHLYRWLRDNVTSDLHKKTQFIDVLLRCCLVYVTETTTLASDVDRDVKPSKAIEKEEEKLFHLLGPLMQKFLLDDSQLQITALYTVQTFCHDRQFPKGLIWRLFNYFYHEDVIDEEIFLKWKEDVNDEYQGKDKALLQVNSWLTWLQEADTEDDDEEET